MTDQKLTSKLNKLREILKEMESIVLAFSGGVDSTFLLKVAGEVLRNRILAVTAHSSIYPKEEFERSSEIAKSLGARHTSIETNELTQPAFYQNPPDRCYHCKKELFQKLRALAYDEGIRLVVDASNLDDCFDFRPGREAAKEIGVRSPLIEAGLNKKEIRIISRRMELPTWDKPSMACLASRFPYGETITLEKIERVDQAEKFLRDLGFSPGRVRSHNKLARIEVESDCIPELTDPKLREKVWREFKGLGFIYITVDLEGYRTGSMNEILQKVFK